MNLVVIQALKLQREVPERFAPQVSVGHPIQVQSNSRNGSSPAQPGGRPADPHLGL
jgi:hypothetical protein